MSDSYKKREANIAKALDALQRTHTNQPQPVPKNSIFHLVYFKEDYLDIASEKQAI